MQGRVRVVWGLWVLGICGRGLTVYAVNVWGVGFKKALGSQERGMYNR